MASSEDVGLDFHRAFQAIDTDHSGEITIEELQNYCRKMDYQDTFVQKWLTLFDEDKNGRITYSEYCNALGLMPKKEVLAKHKAQQTTKKGKGAKTRAEKLVKRRQEKLEETTVTVETVVPATAGKVSAAAPEELDDPSGTTGPSEEAAPEQVAVAEATAGTAAEPMPAPPPPKRQRRRNDAINAGGLMRYSRARMFQRKALYRLAKKSATAHPPRPSSSADSGANKKPKSPRVKPIGGENNGGERRVAAARPTKSLPTEPKPRKHRRRPKRAFNEHKRRLRASIRPGCVLVLLAGRHRGKRVVFLKQLASGLLLVTGPLRINGCPMRRVSQSYVLATRTRLDLDGVRVPDRVNDLYFRRSKRLAKKLAGSSNTDIFASQSTTYQLTQERKEDQLAVDAQVMSAVRQREDKKLLLGYLRSLFCLKSGDKPHNMVF